jgi:thioredoxin-related protein
MRRLTVVLTCLLLGAFGATGFAARDGATVPGGKPLTQREASGRLEVLVFEVDGCALCDVFRRDILPQYQAGPTAKRAPLRFVDINTSDPDKLALRSSLSQVPTAVLMQDGREVDRITGYVGPSAFFRMLDMLLSRVD